MPRLIEQRSEKKPVGAFEAFVDEKDFSFRELSRKSGVSEVTLRRIKNGQSVKRGTVRKLQKFFRVEKQVILDLFKQDGVVVVK
jgi:transcriptional regulator with XRE-family HTH domain